VTGPQGPQGPAGAGGTNLAGKSCACGSVVGVDGSGNLLCSIPTTVFRFDVTSTHAGVFVPAVWIPSDQTQSSACGSVTLRSPDGVLDASTVRGEWSVVGRTGFSTCELLPQAPNCIELIGIVGDTQSALWQGVFPTCRPATNVNGSGYATDSVVVICR
jgi:hypothetical protein